MLTTSSSEAVTYGIVFTVIFVITFVAFKVTLRVAENNRWSREWYQVIKFITPVFYFLIPAAVALLVSGIFHW